MKMNGLLATKIGMTQIYDGNGNVVPVTVVQAGPCVVTQLKTVAKDGYNAVQLGYGKTKKLNKPQKGHLKELNARYLREFLVDKPEEYKVGQEIKAEIFKPGDVVAISGMTIGKGFQGAIKRHHHHRGPMSHGSKSHRLHGSNGAGTTPGRVLPGLEMAGRMGGVMKTVKSIKVIQVKPDENLLLLGGTLPGKKGNLVIIRRKKSAKTETAGSKK
jgi:large subunit ribosomal protein L3